MQNQQGSSFKMPVHKYQQNARVLYQSNLPKPYQHHQYQAGYNYTNMQQVPQQGGMASSYNGVGYHPFGPGPTQAPQSSYYQTPVPDARQGQASPTTPQNSPSSLVGQRFTSGGSTYDILSTIDPRAHSGEDKPLSAGVYKVSRVATNKVFVLKCLRIDRPGRARAEVTVAKQISESGSPHHLNLLQQFLWDADRKQASLLFELCDAGNLEQLVQQNVLDRTNFEERSVWTACTSLTKAIAFLHNGIDLDNPGIKNQGWNTICHLDVKPANIFLSNKGASGGIPRLVLGDFGCAVTRDDVEAGRVDKWHIAYGTAGWYPPEVRRENNPRYGKPTDIWQMGGVFQVMCLLSNAPSLSQLGRGDPCSKAYGKRLNDFTTWCMTTVPENRPDVMALAEYLKELFGAGF